MDKLTEKENIIKLSDIEELPVLASTWIWIMTRYSVCRFLKIAENEFDLEVTEQTYK